MESILRRRASAGDFNWQEKVSILSKFRASGTAQ
jgi:hypothetical protein